MENKLPTPPNNTPKRDRLPSEEHQTTIAPLQATIPDKTKTLDFIVPDFHVIRDSDSNTAVFFFGLPSYRLPRELMQIHGSSPLPRGTHCRHAGRIFGGEPGNPIALVVRAARGTMIRISDPTKTSDNVRPLFLIVGKDFEIDPVATTDQPPVVSSITTGLGFDQTNVSSPLDMIDADLRAIFADKALPLWLRSTLDDQLDFWNKHHAETYYRYIPWAVRGDEFARLIKAAPYWALARWKQDLFPSQVTYCIQRSPAGAVAFCLERLRPSMRSDLIPRFAGEALRHAKGLLSDEEVLTCAEREPYVALSARAGYSPALRAKIIVRVVPIIRIPYDLLPAGLEADILESIAAFPALWIDHFGSITKGMDILATRLGIRPDGPTVLGLLERFAPEGHESFFEFVASQI